MSLTLYKFSSIGCTATLCTTVLLLAGPRPQQSVPGSAPRQGNNAASYFPNGTVNSFADFFSSYLSSIGEPSLLASAKGPSTVSYRLVCMGCQTPNLLVVRLSLNPDGSAAVTTTSATLNISGPSTIGDKIQHSVTAAEADQFFKLIEKAGFWSMPSDEPENPDPHHRSYKLHPGHWVFEGARRGSYHVVYREGPKQSPFTEMVRFLAKNLAKLDEPTIPYAPPAPAD